MAPTIVIAGSVEPTRAAALEIRCAERLRV
jgi:hypothetical protein